MATVDHAGQTEPARALALGSKVWVPWWHLALVLRGGLGLLFLWASLPKLAHPFDFLSSVYDYELVGPQLGFAVAFALPWIELILGTCLLVGLLQRGALTLTMLLSSVFLLARWMWPTTFFLGWTRVDFFFVLSGYLITAILLRHQSSLRFLLTFWVRRALRIWPAYYLLIAILCAREILNGHSRLTEAILGYLTFTQNLSYHWSETISWFSREARHTWALAIEEQFYFIWPLILTLVGRQFLIPVALWLIINSVVSRMLGLYPQVTLARCDGLALGMLLAVVLSGSEQSVRYSRWLHRAFVPIGLAALLFLAISLISADGSMSTVSPQSSFAIFAVSILYCNIIGLIVLHTGHPLLGLLRFRALGYLGRISYGTFLYHLLIIDVVKKHSEYGIAVTQSAAIVLSLLAGAISWECLERPLGNLKKRFPYGGDRKQPHIAWSKAT